MIELFADSGEEHQQIIQEIDRAEQKLNSMEIVTMLSGKHDKENAILTINSGAGGTDAQDWAEMMLRMYLRWGEKNGYETDLIEVSDGDEAGIKSATIIFRGEYAYGYLSAESGVHRLVRISPFNANGKRQTSFASVEVIPEIETAVNVEINNEDLRIDTYRASGAGGQHVNKTDSAVRITHLPSGIVVQCQNQRSQIQNKDTAMKILQSRLQLIEEQKQTKSLEQYKEGKSISWGNQIRSYVFHPYNMVKDHRFSVETSDVQKVMDGDIMMFVEAYLKNKKE